MNFKDVILENIPRLDLSELIEIKNAIESQIEGDDLQAKTLRIIKSSGMLAAVKYVKETMKWGLKESKDFCDKLR